MTDDDIIHALAGALVDHPSWPEPRRVNIFALSLDDAREAIRAAWGPDAQMLTLFFRSDLIASLEAVGGKSGFWVSDETGFEMFIECAQESEAMAMFQSKAGRPPVACVNVDMVTEELARMNDAMCGAANKVITSQAFLTHVAAGEEV